MNKLFFSFFGFLLFALRFSPFDFSDDGIYCTERMLKYIFEFENFIDEIQWFTATMWISQPQEIQLRLD